MHTTSTDIPPPTAAPEVARRIRTVLLRADYTEAGITAATGPVDTRLPQDLRDSLLFHRLDAETPLHLLLRLFHFRERLDLETARQAIRPALLEEWIEAGLLRHAGGSVVSTARLQCYRGFVVASDWPEAGGLT